MCPWPELGLAGAVNPKSVAFRILAALFNVLVTCTPSSQLPSRHDQPAHLQGQLEHARLLTVLEWVTVELSIIPWNKLQRRGVIMFSKVCMPVLLY